jgi:hypothetical protein
LPDFPFGDDDCSKLIPEFGLTEEEYVQLRPKPDWVDPNDEYVQLINQEVGPCVRVGEIAWFIVRFYGGEGEIGLGGIGRYDIEKQELEIRRPPELFQQTAQYLVHHGDYLWFDTFFPGETVMKLDGIGLVRYSWERDELEDFVDSKNGPCGANINGLIWREPKLWVPNDLGVSSFDVNTGVWAHYVPHRRLVWKAVECRDLYAQLLSTLPAEPDPRDGACPLEYGSGALGIFKSYLRNYKPTQYLEIQESTASER